MYSSLLGVKFLREICISVPAFEKMNNKYTAEERVKSFRLFCDYLETTKPKLLDELKMGNKKDGFGSHPSWLLAHSGFRDFIQSHKISNQRKNGYLSGFHYWKRNLQALGLIPETPDLVWFKASRNVSKSLLDFSYSSDTLEELGVDIHDHNDLEEVKRMLNSIKLDLGDIDIENLAEQAAIVLKQRTDAIRRGAEKQFLESAKIRREGLKAIQKYKHHVPLLEKWFSWRKGKGAGKTNPFKFEIEELCSKAWFGAILAWCWYCNDGLEPKEEVLGTRRYNLIRKQFQLRKLKIDDKAIAAAIGCTSEMINSAIMLLIHDLYANVDSVRNISVNCDFSNGYGLQGIDWEKLRANKILTALDVDNSHNVGASKVVRTVRQVTRNYRKACLEIDSDKLFLHYHSSKSIAKHKKTKHVVPLNPCSEYVTQGLKEIINKASNGKWAGTGRSVRISLLLYKALTGGLIAVRQAAQHNCNRSPKAYADKAPMRIGLQKKMREFKEWLQVLVTIKIEDVPKKLGIDELEYEKRKQEILSSRFGGVYCKNAREGIQPGTKKGIDCNKISKCLTCKNKRNLFVASEDNVMHLLMWNEAMVKAQQIGELDIKNNSDWQFWALFIETMISRLEHGGVRYKAILEGAKECMQKQENEYLKIDFKAVL